MRSMQMHVLFRVAPYKVRFLIAVPCYIEFDPDVSSPIAGRVREFREDVSNASISTCTRTPTYYSFMA